MPKNINIILSINLLFLLLLTGCIENKTVCETNVNNDSYSMNNIFEKLNELKTNNDFHTNSNNFNLQGEIFVSSPNDETKIVMNFVLDQPKSTMCNTELLVLFDDEILDYIIAESPYVTNINGQLTSIYPADEPKGFEVARGFLPAGNVDDIHNLDNIFTNAKAFVSWTNEQGTKYSEQIILDSTTLKLSKDVYDLFQERLN
jgi:hypothetical protein